MTESEITLLVAEAVASHDDRTTWMDELTANAETIAVLGLAAISAIVAIVRWVNTRTNQVTEQFHALDKRVAAGELYRDTHDHEDRAAHDRLERGDADVLRELRAFRKESSTQHQELAQQLNDSTRKSDEGRSKLHDRIESTNRDLSHVSASVSKLIGYHEAKSAK